MALTVPTIGSVGRSSRLTPDCSKGSSSPRCPSLGSGATHPPWVARDLTDGGVANGSGGGSMAKALGLMHAVRWDYRQDEVGLRVGSDIRRHIGHKEPPRS